jgi:hypothetical protein
MIIIKRYILNLMRKVSTIFCNKDGNMRFFYFFQTKGSVFKKFTF